MVEIKKVFRIRKNVWKEKKLKRLKNRVAWIGRIEPLLSASLFCVARIKSETIDRIITSRRQPESGRVGTTAGSIRRDERRVPVF